ncbi:MAG: hypothetical protein IT340_19900 [Chloroflexi bacterium]|nr:hypothetical protein [Chloroflexota bacterium]
MPDPSSDHLLDAALARFDIAALEAGVAAFTKRAFRHPDPWKHEHLHGFRYDGSLRVEVRGGAWAIRDSFRWLGSAATVHNHPAWHTSYDMPSTSDVLSLTAIAAETIQYIATRATLWRVTRVVTTDVAFNRAAERRAVAGLPTYAEKVAHLADICRRAGFHLQRTDRRTGVVTIVYTPTEADHA